MMYEVDYTVSTPEYGVLNIEALDTDDAEWKAVETLKETFPEATNIEIEMIKEIKLG